MEKLTINISEIDPDNLQKVKISCLEREGAEGTCILPFDQEMALPAILKVLEYVEFAEARFTDVEKAWMRQENLIREEATGLTYTDRRLQQQIIGKKLFKALFSEKKLSDAYTISRDQANKANKELHLEIRFNAESEFAGAYPWELLYDNNDFLCGGGRSTLTRYIVYDNSGQPRRQVSDCVHILLVSPRPARLPGLSEEEAVAVREGLKQVERNGTVHIEQLEKPTYRQLQRYLRKRTDDLPHILHFDGHGTFGRLCLKCGGMTVSPTAEKCTNRDCSATISDVRPQGYLAFEDDQGNVDYVSAKTFADELREAAMVSQDGSALKGLCLVVLSACKTAVAIQGQNVFNGVAQRLIDARIPAVVAMQFRITAKGARDFTEFFYSSLSKGDPLSTAVSSGRTALGREGDQWYRPVLYMRWRDNEGGRLFDIKRAEPTLPLSGSKTELGSPDDYITRSSKFVPGEDEPEIVAVDQREVIYTFAEMVLPAYRKNSKFNILGLHGPKGTGKTLALERFEFICKDLQQSHSIIYCRINLDKEAPRPIRLLNNILDGLQKSADYHSKTYNSNLSSKTSQILADLREKLRVANTTVANRPEYSYEPYELGSKLYDSLFDLSKECSIVLMFDNCHKLEGSETCKWLFNDFLTLIRDGGRKIVAVVTSERNLEILCEGFSTTWDSVTCCDPVSKFVEDDLLALAEIRGIRNMNSEEARTIMNLSKSARGYVDISFVRSALDVFKAGQEHSVV